MGKTLISTHTPSNVSTLDITSGIDSTYPVYEFHYYNMHPVTNQVDFMVQFNAHDGSSQLTGFDETTTSSFFYSQGGESGSGNTSYYATMDVANSGATYIPLNYEVGSDADQSTSGVFTLYDPSGTHFIKHFLSDSNFAQSDNYAAAAYVGGYINTTNAITQISFKFDSGNIESGTMKMFGVV
jgi:hypothetical protein